MTRFVFAPLTSLYLYEVLKKFSVKRQTTQAAWPWDLTCACPSLIQSSNHRSSFLKGEGLLRISVSKTKPLPYCMDLAEPMEELLIKGLSLQLV